MRFFSSILPSLVFLSKEAARRDATKTVSAEALRLYAGNPFPRSFHVKARDAKDSSAIASAVAGLAGLEPATTDELASGPQQLDSDIAASRHALALARGTEADEPPRRKSMAGRLVLLLLAGAGLTGAALALVDRDSGAMHYIAGLAQEASRDAAVPAAAARPVPQSTVAQSPVAPSPVRSVAVSSQPVVAAPARDEPVSKPSPVVTIEAAVAPVAAVAVTAAAAAGVTAPSSPVETARDVASVPVATATEPPAVLAVPVAAVPAPPATADPANVSFYAKRFAGIGAGERECLAQAVYYEARGEPVAGQIAVAQVILNRSMSSSWPSTICGVVQQGQERGEKCQFSFACMKRGLDKPHGEMWQQASWVASEVLSGGAWLRELTEATHYHRKDLAPVWRLALKEIGRVGVHVFYGPPGSKQVLALEVAGDGGAGQRVPFSAAATSASSSIVRRQDIGHKTAASVKRRKETAAAKHPTE